ncbi:hypothetical protein LCGC14_1559730 [marine sediment metagenome]|uniref:UspA domain-containing protein n=1 Tax=marine sediment metagenome TaxID=412755 RepID=A0A0F9LNJ3_9ZZZZ
MLRVLLPTDFSDNAFEAITYAILTFEHIECKFYLMHTYMPPIYLEDYVIGSLGEIGLRDIMRENVVTKLNKLRSRLENEFKNVKHTFQSLACLNTLSGQVEEMVNEEKVDIIIMGTKGATGAQEILLGTHTIHIIKKANCPIIAIPPNFKYEVPGKILFPTDYEIEFAKDCLRFLLKIAQQHSSKIEVLNVSYGNELSEAQQDNKRNLVKVLKDFNHSFHDLPEQNVIQAINNFQLNHKTNLLVMVKNKHTFVERMFFEPLIKKIGLHIRIPFMVIPEIK